MEAEISKLSAEIEAIKQNVIYQNAFEWRFEFPEVLDDDGGFEGFDIVIGNPPYIQLQKMGEVADALQTQGYQTFVRTGDIYALFYEQGVRLLKPKGLLGYITSNKWMRAAYGQSLREYFLKETNPLQLIDFANLQLFESVTVSTNILIIENAAYQGEMKTCIISQRMESLKEMSDYFRQYAVLNSTPNGNQSWVVLSDVESRIKLKIEQIGLPLLEWNMQINYGIKTGFNDAFIIDDKMRTTLLEKSPEAETIIRPILRGRDIKRYHATFKNLWLINTHNGQKSRGIERIRAEAYPAIYEHLHTYKMNLERRQDKGADWMNLRNCTYLT